MKTGGEDMNKSMTIIAAVAGAAFAAASAIAQPGDHKHMGASAPDARHAVELPAPMHEHMEANMRAHLEAFGEIISALSADDGAKAAKIASERLGVNSMGAGACKPGAAEAGGAAAMMAKHMPEEMRALGLAMHESADKFAQEAGKLKPGGDAKPALAALAQVTQNCAACHSAYRLK
jgi:hypothetical protein